MIASKVITAGFFPMAAVILSPSIANRLKAATSRLEELPTVTTGAHAVGCAIATEALDQITDGGVLAHTRSVAPLFQQRLHALGNHPLVGEARGVGLMGAFELVSDKATKQPFAASLGIGERLANEAFRNGLICRPLGNSVILAQPFIVSHEQVEELANYDADAVHRSGCNPRHPRLLTFPQSQSPVSGHFR